MKRRWPALLVIILVAGVRLLPAETEAHDPGYWVTQLGADSFAARERATARLEGLGFAARQALIPAIDSPDPETRLRARQLWRRLRWYVIAGAEADTDQLLGELQIDIEHPSFGGRANTDPQPWETFIRTHGSGSLYLLLQLRQAAPDWASLRVGMRLYLSFVDGEELRSLIAGMSDADRDAAVDAFLAVELEDLSSATAAALIRIIAAAGRHQAAVHFARQAFLRWPDDDIQRAAVGAAYPGLWAQARTAIETAADGDRACLLMAFYAGLSIALGTPDAARELIDISRAVQAAPENLAQLAKRLPQLDLPADVATLLAQASAPDLRFQLLRASHALQGEMTMPAAEWAELRASATTEEEAYRLAQAVEAVDLAEEAESAWQRVLELAPEDSVYDANACLRLAPYLETRGEFAKAAALYERGLEITATAGAQLQGEPAVRIRMHAADLRRRAAEDADGYESWRQRGRTAMARQRYDEAGEAFEAAIALRPKSLDAYLDLFDLHKIASHFDALDGFAQRLAGVAARSADEYSILSYCFSELMALDQALVNLERAQELQADHMLTFLTRANIYLKQGKFEAAKSDLEAAQRAGANDQQLQQAWAFYYAYQGDFKSAVPFFHANYRAAVEVPFYRIWLFLAREQSGIDDRAALRRYRLAHADADDKWGLQLVDFCLGDLDWAALQQTIVASDNQNVARGRRCEANFYRGAVAALAGDEKTAIAAYRDCAEMRIGVYFEHAWSLAELRRLQADHVVEP